MQLELDLGDPIDWSSLEDHVRPDGTFDPPLTEEALRRIAARERRTRPGPEPHTPFPSSKFGFDGERTYRTTTTRLRFFSYAPDEIEIARDGGTIHFTLHRIVEKRGDWFLRGYRSTPPGHRLVVLNAEWCPHRVGIEVVRNGNLWIARCDWEDIHRVEEAGFRFDPITREWKTADRETAARLDPSLRRSEPRPRTPRYSQQHRRPYRSNRGATAAR